MEPWRVKLAAGDTDAAWDLFIDRYRRLIFATIRRIVEEDAVLDVFAHVCQALAADRLALLRRYRDDAPRRARFSTWLVTVIHNEAINWVRQRSGRRRIVTPTELSALQRQIFMSVFVEQRSHGETFELLRAKTAHELSFAVFLKELAATYRVIQRARPRGVMHYLSALPNLEPAPAVGEEQLAAEEIGEKLNAALQSVPRDHRIALQLFVVEGMAAVDVARTLRWPTAKTVYNRVYRALKQIRDVLEREGIEPGDL